MTKYTIAYWLVTAIGVLAFIAFVTIAVVLVHRLVSISGHERVCAWLDDLGEQDAAYMEVEQERRTALFHGDPDASSLRRYYGVRFLIERALHRITYDLAWRIWRFQKENVDLYTR